MEKYTVRKYTSEDFALWNAFVAKAKNATFLFNRNFMEYHNDRFTDFSLLVFEDKKLVAVFPANRAGEELHSHQGLSYGGVVVENSVKIQEFIDIFEAVCLYAKLHFKKMFLKVLPAIYSKHFSDELLYVLFLKNAELIRRDTLFVLDNQVESDISKKRKYEIKKGEKHNLEIRETTDFSAFWNEILIPVLHEKHQAKPVHSLDEIKLLHSRFPDNIKQFDVYFEDKIVAGTTLFVTENVVHSQYIGSDWQRSKLGSVDFLYDFLIKKYALEKRFFDMGASNKDNGKTLNEGLAYWKESFGARTLVQDFYELEL
ncbi:MAG: GNAT family N-acetyltransferase [Flavobacteriaceae bacterium]